eukprot:scaffold20755_cov136-Isochrysis_galbana.AAC.7
MLRGLHDCRDGGRPGPSALGEDSLQAVPLQPRLQVGSRPCFGPPLEDRDCLRMHLSLVQAPEISKLSRMPGCASSSAHS